ncbi:MAG: hypothetical protein DYG89_44105 [Caldilinea sp. CFX5]|nr:hypothetical protein [Caldilinea sp. CFX5]
MAGTTRVQYYIDNDALAIVEANAPSPKRRGEWVSKAIREYGAKVTLNEEEIAGSTLEQLVMLVQRIERRIIQLDSRIA